MHKNEPTQIEQLIGGKMRVKVYYNNNQPLFH